MGQTMAEKIFSRNAGKKLYAGGEGLFTPDLNCAYDYPGYIDSYEHQLKNELGLHKIAHPEKFVFFIDHFNPAGSTDYRAVHVKTRRFAKELGVKLYEDVGIGHQVIMEEGRVTPGMLITHFDGHVSTLGALGAFAMSIRNSMIEVLATSMVALVVPPTLRVNLVGRLPKGVTIRDAFHTLVRDLGPAGARGMCVEYGGSGLATVDFDSRCTLCNQAMFLSAVTAIMEPDVVTEKFLRKHTVADYQAILPDDDAAYERTVTLDLSSVEPILVAPPSSANTVLLQEYAGLKVDVGYLGSCASGRMTDFTQLLEILEGKKKHEEFRLELVPTSTAIQRELAANGMMTKLIDTGACLYYPSCDFCYGMLGVMTQGEVALSTGTLNLPGRKGCVNSRIFTASPYTIAAAAITGKITDPREFL